MRLQGLYQAMYSQQIPFGVPVAPLLLSHGKISACIMDPMCWGGSSWWSTWEEKKCS